MSKSDTGSVLSDCPATHPFVFNRGLSCCKFYRRKNNETLNKFCNGDWLLWNDPAICCHNDDMVNCPSNEFLCKNGPNAASKNITLEKI